MLSTATGTSQNNNKDNYKVTITYQIHNMSSHYSTYLSTLIHVTIKIILLSSYYHSHFTDEDIETWRSNCPKFHSEQKESQDSNPGPRDSRTLCLSFLPCSATSTLQKVLLQVLFPARTFTDPRTN